MLLLVFAGLGLALRLSTCGHVAVPPAAVQVGSEGNAAPAPSRLPRESGNPGVPTEEPPPVESTVERKRWEMRLLDATGHPLAGVEVSLDEPVTTTVLSGSDGRVTIETDGERDQIRIHAPQMFPSKHVVTTSPSTIAFAYTPQLVVRMIDTSTGLAIAGGSVTAVSPSGTRTPLVAESDCHVLAAGPISGGVGIQFLLDVAPPAGFTVMRSASAEGLALLVWVSKYVRTVVVPVPLWRELDLRCHVVDRSGRSVEGAKVTKVTLLRLDHAFEAAPTSHDGGTRIRCVPAVGRHIVAVEAGWPGGWGVSNEVVIDERSYAPVTLLVTEAAGSEPAREPFALSGRAGKRGVRDGGAESAAAVAGGTVQVRVARRNLAPASCARVSHSPLMRVETANAIGIVQFHDVPPGDYEAVLWEPGLVYTRSTVTARVGETTEWSLTEAPGVMTRVRVVDEADEPVQYAEISVSRDADGRRYPLLSIADDIQYVPILTDRNGECLIEDASAGIVWVSARLGGLEASERGAAGGVVELTLPSD